VGFFARKEADSGVGILEIDLVGKVGRYVGGSRRRGLESELGSNFDE
jgi:hypothetical protein